MPIKPHDLRTGEIMSVKPEDLHQGFYDFGEALDKVGFSGYTKKRQPDVQSIKPGDFSWTGIRYDELSVATSSRGHRSESIALGYDLEALIQGGQARLLELSGKDLLPEEGDLLRYWSGGEVFKLNLGEGLEAYHLRGGDQDNPFRQFNILLTYDVERSERATKKPPFFSQQNLKPRFQVRSYVVSSEDGSDGFYNLNDFVPANHPIILKTDIFSRSFGDKACIYPDGGDLELAVDLRTLDGLYSFLHEAGHGDRMIMQNETLGALYTNARGLVKSVQDVMHSSGSDLFQTIAELEIAYGVGFEDALRIVRADEKYATKFGLDRLDVIAPGIGLTSEESEQARVLADYYLFSYDNWPNAPVRLMYPSTRCTTKTELIGHEQELVLHRRNIQELFALVDGLGLAGDEFGYRSASLSENKYLFCSGGVVEINTYDDNHNRVSSAYFSLFEAGVIWFGESDRQKPSLSLALRLQSDGTLEAPGLRDLPQVLEAEEQALTLLRGFVEEAGNLSN